MTLARRNKRGNYTGNQRAKENKWDTFKNQRKERKPKILPTERKPSHSISKCGREKSEASSPGRYWNWK